MDWTNGAWPIMIILAGILLIELVNAFVGIKCIMLSKNISSQQEKSQKFAHMTLSIASMVISLTMVLPTLFAIVMAPSTGFPLFLVPLFLLDIFLIALGGLSVFVSAFILRKIVDRYKKQNTINVFYKYYPIFSMIIGVAYFFYGVVAIINIFF